MRITKDIYLLSAKFPNLFDKTWIRITIRSAKFTRKGLKKEVNVD